jgi:type I restriction enzyme S subunit
MSDRLRLADLVARRSLLVNDGYRTRADELGRPGIPVLRVAEVQHGHLTPTFGDHVLESYRSKIADKVSRPRDVVVTTKGTVGRVALVSADDPEFVYSPQVCFFRCLDDTIDPRWLYYWFSGPEFTGQASGVQAQTDMASYINLADMRAMRLTLPELSEQRAVAAILGALDNKIQSNRRIWMNSWALCSAMYADLTSSGALRPLKELLDLAYGKALPASQRTNGDVVVYGSGGATGAHDQALLRGPAVIVGRKGTVGAVHWSAGDCWPIDTTFYAVPRAGWSMIYLYFALLAADLPAMNSDSAVPGLNRTAALGRPVAAVEPAAASNWAAVAEPLVARAAAAEEECRRLADLRDALLPELLSGRIRVPEAGEAVESALV